MGRLGTTTFTRERHRIEFCRLGARCDAWARHGQTGRRDGDGLVAQHDAKAAKNEYIRTVPTGATKHNTRQRHSVDKTWKPLQSAITDLLPDLSVVSAPVAERDQP